MRTRIFDISQRIGRAMPVWPGDTVFGAEPVWAHGPDCPVAVARLRMSPHSGAHADAPLHYDPHGKSIADVDLAPYLGPARVVDLKGHEGAVEPEHLRSALRPGVIRILIRTFARFPHDTWPSTFAPIAAETIRMLAQAGVVLIGTDAPSLDPETSRTMEAHRAVRDADMRVLEGLVLDDVPPGDYELIALPLKLDGVDASPVRAILRELGASAGRAISSR